MNLRPLGHEPYDFRLRSLRLSPVPTAHAAYMSLTKQGLDRRARCGRTLGGRTAALPRKRSRMTQTGPDVPAARARSRAGWRDWVRQIGLASVPVWSAGLLAFAPFLWRAIIRRRGKDWLVFAGYLAAVALTSMLLSIHKPPTAVNAVSGVLILGLVIGAPVHTLIAFRPGAGVPSFRGARAIRAVSELPARGEMREQSYRQEAAAYSDVAQAMQAGWPEQGTTRASAVQAGERRRSDEAARRPANREDRRRGGGRLKRANAAAKLAWNKSRADDAAARAARQAAHLEKTETRQAARAAAQAARIAAPRYGWVETRRTYRRETIFGNHRTETIVSLPSQRNARRRTRQKFGVTITEEWRRLD